MQSKKRFLLNQDGATIMMLIVALIVIGLLGAAISTMTTTSTVDSINLNHTQRAYYLAESGIRWMEAEYKNDPDSAEEVYKKITDPNTTPGGVIQMGQASEEGQLSMDVHPFYGRCDSVNSTNTKLVIDYPGAVDPDVFKELINNGTQTMSEPGTLWHNGGELTFNKVDLVNNTDGTDTLNITIDPTTNLPGNGDRVSFTAQVEGDDDDRTIKNDVEETLKLSSGYEFFPESNGVIRTKATKINGSGEDFIKFHYKRRDGDTLYGITHYETSGGDKITTATLKTDEPLVLLPCYHFVATGTVGSATSTVDGFLYDGKSSEDVAVIEHVEDGDSFDNWNGSEAFKKTDDGAFKVSDMGDPHTVGGSKEVYEASMTLDWEKAGVDLLDAVELAGGFLSYEVQTKIKQQNETNTTAADNSYLAGISFRVRDDGTQYGVSLFRPREIVEPETDTLVLTGVVRDFKARRQSGGHPDFETTICGLKKGIVTNDLDVYMENGEEQRKPIFNDSATSLSCITSKARFDEWYRDTDGVNLKTTYDLTFTKNEDDVYSVKMDFFPINGELYGNYSGGKNYHFTFELHSKFTYTAGQEFSFTGDDDVFVYIDNKLVIDIGGIHGKSSASITLDANATDRGGRLLNLEEGGTYNFDFFFAERHTSESNFLITTDIELTNLTDGVPGSTDKTGGSTVWPHIPPDNGEMPQKDNTTIHGDGWNTSTEKWLAGVCNPSCTGGDCKKWYDKDDYTSRPDNSGTICESGSWKTGRDCRSATNAQCAEWQGGGHGGGHGGGSNCSKCCFNWACEEYNDPDCETAGPEFFDSDDYTPLPGQMADSICTNDCFPICENTHPTYYDVWNTGFDWESQNTTEAVNKDGANNTFLIIWQRTPKGSSYEYNWLSYRLLDEATDLAESATDGIIQDSDTGKIRDWSTLGVRVKEVAYLWVDVTDTNAYNDIDRGDYIAVGTEAGGYCFDKPLQITSDGKGMILLTRVNRDGDELYDDIYPFNDGLALYVEGQAGAIGTVADHQDQVNLIQAYVSSNDGDGDPENNATSELIALDKNRLGNKRDNVNWLPEDHETLDASNDYHRVIQWMGWNSEGYYNYATDDFNDTEVCADTPWTRNGFNIERIFARFTTIMTTVTDNENTTFSLENNPEVGIHAFGAVEEKVDDEGNTIVVNSGIDMWFDDFAIKIETSIPELGATIETAQSR